MATLTPSKPALLPLLYQAVKAALQLRFTGYGGGRGQGLNAMDWLFYNNSGVNFGREAGDLTQSSLVMSAVNWLGRILPEAPLQVIEADAKGNERPIPNHPATALMKRPNPYYSGAQLWKAYALSWIVNGNPYYVKVRNGYGQVTQLWYVPPSMMRPLWPENGREFISEYEYVVDGYSYSVPVQDVLHFRDGANPADMGRTGLSGVASVLSEICADKEVPVYHYLLLKAGGVPPIVLALKEGQAGVDFDPKLIKDTYIRATSGDNRGKVFVSGNAVEITKIGFNPSEMDLKALRHLPESRFASVIGIAKETLGFGAADVASTYNNVEQADKRSIKTYVKPLWGYIEDELTHQLGPDFGFTEKQRFAFDLSEVAALQEDRSAIYQREVLAYEKGVKKRSEARSSLGLEFTPEDEVYYVQAASEQPKPMALPTGEPMPKQLINGKHHGEVN